MKILIAVLCLAVVATSAFAQPVKVRANHTDLAGISQVYAPGNQTFPNADQFFDGQEAR
jgi:hypothetical protein